MTLESIEQKLATLTREVAACHSTVRDRYNALDARLDAGVNLAVKSKWTPVCVALYSTALLWAGMVLEKWFSA